MERKSLKEKGAVLLTNVDKWIEFISKHEGHDPNVLKILSMLLTKLQFLVQTNLSKSAKISS